MINECVTKIFSERTETGQKKEELNKRINLTKKPRKKKENSTSYPVAENPCPYGNCNYLSIINKIGTYPHDYMHIYSYILVKVTNQEIFVPYEFVPTFQIPFRKLNQAKAVSNSSVSY